MNAGKKNKGYNQTEFCNLCNLRPRLIRKTGVNAGKRESFCKECKQAKTEEWRQAHPDAWALTQFKARLKNTFGLTYDDFCNMMAAQGYRCAICRVPLSMSKLGESDRANVDHCHKRMKVREILCRDCNVGLGSFKDDPLRLELAAAYLRKHDR